MRNTDLQGWDGNFGKTETVIYGVGQNAPNLPNIGEIRNIHGFTEPVGIILSLKRAGASPLAQPQSGIKAVIEFGGGPKGGVSDYVVIDIESGVVFNLVAGFVRVSVFTPDPAPVAPNEPAQVSCLLAPGQVLAKVGRVQNSITQDLAAAGTMTAFVWPGSGSVTVLQPFVWSYLEEIEVSSFDTVAGTEGQFTITTLDLTGTVIQAFIIPAGVHSFRFRPSGKTVRMVVTNNAANIARVTAIGILGL